MKGLLSRLEFLVIGLFAVVFLFWTVSKCSAHKRASAAVSPETLLPDSTVTVSVDTVPPAKQDSVAVRPVVSTAAVPPFRSRLYITIDKLKLRASPGLKGELIGEMRLFEEVYFLEEMTDSLYEINLGKEMANEPYVKIQTEKGKVGWVYGAGVHYARKKRGGVLE
ncbi:MAG: hypothetical protein RLY31_2388 [Bacteroidota bacterium]|jgi:hypothetical protein